MPPMSMSIPIRTRIPGKKILSLYSGRLSSQNSMPRPIRKMPSHMAPHNRLAFRTFFFLLLFLYGLSMGVEKVFRFGFLCLLCVRTLL